jgi:mono/diheme cytochrome c family protein
MTSLRVWLASGLLAALAVLGACSQSDHAAQVARGKYLVSIMGCSDCHTPGGLTPHPDMTLYLAGSDADFIVPGLGAFTPSNLTSDKATGLGAWTHDQIVAAFTTGKRPDGRVLSPAMPWNDFAKLSKADADAIADYLQSLAPISRNIPGPRAGTPCSDPNVECIVRRPG